MTLETVLVSPSGPSDRSFNNDPPYVPPPGPSRHPGGSNMTLGAPRPTKIIPEEGVDNPSALISDEPLQDQPGAPFRLST